MTLGTRATERFNAVSVAGSRRTRKFDRPTTPDGRPLKISEFYGCNTFSFDLMATKLPPAEVAVLKEFATSAKPLTIDLANKVAAAVKEWCIVRGATHYCHWFQPQTGATAEKHDSFLSFDKNGSAIEYFTGAQLIQSEPDASSFPSGGRRSTFEARGYTAWDASSPMFLMQSENGLTLCIPSVFISYSGEALDEKTPLLRSIAAISKAASEALSLMGENSPFVNATAGPEQEYFLIDEALFNIRPDLILAGRSIFGRKPARGQQMEDHYFGTIKPRILSYIMETEHELYKLGVPCKTRHNEVAPAQYETAPIYENANVAADHNQVTMEVIKSVARRHNLVALLHEKPFSGINGSGKHLNWSLADSHGKNLLEPGDKPNTNLRFLYFLAATMKGINDNGPLLRMSVAHAGNDFRLGANEAPPAIISIFLGETLNEVVDRIISSDGSNMTDRMRHINLDLAKVPVISRDNTDRNRTSPFAFTGNKFEFRAVGASQSVSFPMTMVNTAVTKAIIDLNNEVKKIAAGNKPTQEQILTVIRNAFVANKKVCFEGNNYDTAWHKEAEQRGLPNLRNTPQALKVLNDPQYITALTTTGVLNEVEAKARYNVKIEQYIKVKLIEMESLFELLCNHVFPAAVAQQSLQAEAMVALKQVTDVVDKTQLKSLEETTRNVSALVADRERLKLFIAKCGASHDELALAEMIALDGANLMDDIRKNIEDAELIVDDTLWSLPKYREMLFLL